MTTTHSSTTNRSGDGPANGAAVEDRIERQVDIDADAATVWTLVSEPGWWINDGRVVQHRIQRRDAAGGGGGGGAVEDEIGAGTDGSGGSGSGALGVFTVRDPHHGSFVLQVVALREPRYAAFRWLSAPGGEVPGSGSTLVEFFLEDRPGGVVLRVVESGFAALTGEETDRRRAFDANSRGWEVELEAARRHLLGS